MKKIIYLFLTFILLSHIISAQRDVYSDYQGSMLTISPSFAGMGDMNRFMAKYRKNPDFVNSNLYCFSYDMSLPKMNSGIGILLNRDAIVNGALSYTDFALMYSYDIKLNENLRVRPGLNVSYTQMNFDITKVTFGDQMSIIGNTALTTIEIPPDEARGYIDAAASLMVYSDRLKTGFTIDHLLRPEQSGRDDGAKLPLALSLYGDYKFMLNKATDGMKEESISVYAYYRTFQKMHSITLGGYWQKQFLIAGAGIKGFPATNNNMESYSGLDAILFNVGFNIKDITITYMYDFSLNTSFNFHEISFRFEIPAGERIISTENEE